MWSKAMAGRARPTDGCSSGRSPRDDHGALIRRDREALTAQLRSEVGDERVVQAVLRTPREQFVPEDLFSSAYCDSALPIGWGQTISQPLMVGLMVAALRVTRADIVLEVGTGSGYQAAVLAELAGRIVTVERLPELKSTAAERLARLGYRNIDVRQAGFELGSPPDAPFDAIVVAAGAPKIPTALIDQLSPGGRLVVPVGSAESQELMRVIQGPKDLSIHTLGACRFVPLIGEGAWDEDDPQLAGRTGRWHS